MGSEYSIAGALPGDQVMPSVSINGAGGYIVWQDNATDGDGWGISARALNSSLMSAVVPFRVNSTSKGDQENARVALLQNGGAAFVWQGGRQGFQHIYARFLSSSNTWLALDQMVNASAKNFQANASVAVLNSGNVVIVYASFNPTTMQDVYGQIFSPAGQKIGGEFQVNQQTAFNQRTPAVAALTNGGFVVTWVSEQQQRPIVNVAGHADTAAHLNSLLPSVDIYARFFDSNGNSLIQEFPVNTSFNTCANPAVASAADGSVMFAWSGKDPSILNNGWDIYSRVFTLPGGVPLGSAEQRVNTQLYGDQFAPHVTSSGTNYLIVWTSLGQDGSGAGIYGQFLNIDGSASGTELQVNSSTLGSQQEPALASDGWGRFLVTWTSPSYSPSRNDLFAQIYADGNFVPPVLSGLYGAPAYVGDAPAKTDSGSSLIIPAPYIEPPILGYPGTISTGSTDLPVANAFSLAAGTYRGLFYEIAAVSPASSGYFIATVSGKSYTAKLTIGGTTYPAVSGTFDAYGNSRTNIIARGTLPPLSVSFQVDLSGADQIHGKVTAGNSWSALLVADRQVFNKTIHPTPLVGRYTMAVPGAGKGPEGSGFGTINVDLGGTVTWGVTLGDGTKPGTLKSPSAISKTGIWPLYGSFGGGSIIGWVQLTNNAPGTNGAVTGDLICFKAASAAAASYKAGYTNETSLIGAQYAGPGTDSMQLQLSGAGLNPSLTSSVQFIGGNSSVKGPNLKTFSLKNDGSFTGSFQSPGVSFKGVLLESGSGAGFFIYTNKQSGQVNLNQP